MTSITRGLSSGSLHANEPTVVMMEMIVLVTIHITIFLLTKSSL